MKKLLPHAFAALFVLSWNTSHSQLLKRIRDEVKNRAENKVVNKAGNATDKTIDNAAGTVTKEVKGNGKTSEASDPSQLPTEDKPVASAADYRNYDFVPGDKIIFQPDLSGEQDAELPSRFTVEKGNAEIQTYDGEKILHLQANGNATVTPLMNSENYLPEQFTLEFDMMYENDATNFKYIGDFSVNFRKPEDGNYGGYPLYHFTINGANNVHFGDQNAGRVNITGDLAKSLSIPNTWHHISIYVRKNIAKAYVDQYRVFASNKLPAGVGKVDFSASRYGIKIKNVRLAAGGSDKYNAVITDGKIITHGILFDASRATIKPESMGTLNEIAKLMTEHNDLKFEIDGHTDSDGSDETNMKLSQQRADAVKATLVEMGIDQSRLTTKGFGESKPIDKNNTPEGKANNRRVEFVKI